MNPVQHIHDLTLQLVTESGDPYSERFSLLLQERGEMLEQLANRRPESPDERELFDSVVETGNGLIETLKTRKSELSRTLKNIHASKLMFKNNAEPVFIDYREPVTGN